MSCLETYKLPMDKQILLRGLRREEEIEKCHKHQDLSQKVGAL